MIVSPKALKVLDVGVLRVNSSLEFAEKLGLLHGALYQLVSMHRPVVGIFEKPFYGKNAMTTIRLAETRGALMAACARNQIEIKEITPAEVKKCVTGSGRADKSAVSQGLKALMQLDFQGLPPDAADAVGIAFSYCMQLKNFEQLSRTSKSLSNHFYRKLKPSISSPKASS